MFYLRHAQRTRPWHRTYVWAVVVGLVASAVTLRAGVPQTIPWFHRPIAAVGVVLGGHVEAVRARVRGWWMDPAAHERARLQRELRAAQTALAVADEWRLERDRLRALLAWKDATGSTVRVASVIRHDLDALYQTVVVNHGAADGIAVGMPVTSSAGLVGRVAQVGARQARILLLTDPNHAVDVVSQRSRARGIIQGRGRGVRLGRLGAMTRIEYTEPGADFAEGDTMVTSGLDGNYPAGIPVGTISRVTRDESGVLQSADCLPMIDWSYLSEVGILPHVERTIEPAIE